MGNTTNGLKKFLQNKNTVTVIGVVLAVLVLYVGYNMRVKSAVNPITVPYAKETIKGGTQITQDKVGTYSDKRILGKLVENVKVLAVKDASGQAVFANLDEQRTPAMIIFAVPEDMYILLKKAEYLRNYDTTLIPVPTNESLSDKPGDITISSEDLKNWINRVTVWTES